MPKHITFAQTGGPEVLQYSEFELTAPAAGEVQLAQTAVGVDFIDIYLRTGAYPSASFPAPIGFEAAGVVQAIGAGVTGFSIGQRVAYFGRPAGSYATHRNVLADRCVTLPDTVSDEMAAAALLKGLTAEFLLHRTAQVKPGDTLLIHAAAGGVGLILSQWAAALGATVIGTVSTDAKAQLARAHGCHHTIVYSRENFAERVKAITGGKGCDIVYDSVGKDTFLQSLDCLRPRGLAVLFGAASGPVAPLDLQTLAAKGSLYVTRPTLFTYTAEASEYRAGCAALFAALAAGTVKLHIGERFALADAAKAHSALASRVTTGAMVLAP